MRVADKDLCTGCMLCKNVCAFDAISFVEENGYYYPHINEEKCRRCNNCFEKCPAKKEPCFKKSKNVYLSWTNDLKLRSESSSGGIFGELAYEVINTGGYVAGATYTNGFSRVEHVLINRLQDINKLMISKYVQSDTSQIWGEVLNAVDTGKPVLFSGTPCQVDALHNFFDKEPENLISIDLVCRGVPSPVVWEAYVRELIKMWGAEVSSVNYRYKGSYSWTDRKVRITFLNGQEYLTTRSDDPFAKLFFHNIAMKKSCFECRYSDISRTGDITLGDFWALRDKDIPGKNKGISMIMENTQKGSVLLSKIKDKVYLDKKNDIDITENNA